MMDGPIPTASCRAVIFDMDELLLDTERIAKWAWKKAAAERGYLISDELINRVVGRQIEDTHRIFREGLGQDFPSEDVRKKRMEYADTLMQEEGVPLKAGARELLSFLRGCRMACGVATSTQREAALWRLERAEVVDLFDAIVTREDVVNSKPDPEIFLTAARRLGQPAGACLVLEDSESGVRAAHAAGMSVINVPDLLAPSAEVRSLSLAVMESLREVRAWMERTMAQPPGR